MDSTALPVQNPHQIVSIRWVVDGSTEVEAWLARHTVMTLERAGYTVLSETRFN